MAKYDQGGGCSCGLYRVCNCDLNKQASGEIARPNKKEKLMGKDLMSELLNEIDNEYASIVDDGIEAGDITGHISTGSYALNALLSGSIYGGIPANKVTALAGEPSTGKTFYAINVVREFLNANPTGFVFYFETESAVSKDMFVDRGVDVKRVMALPVATIQEFRTQAVQILDKYMAAKSTQPMMFVLDSLGNLSTQKEMEDITAGKDTRDMTRAQLIRGAFRVLTLKLGKAKVPLLITNHVYEVVGSYVPMKKMNGGCLVAGTKIQTPSGYKSIEDLQRGEFVSTLFGPMPISETFNFNDKDVFEITFDDGQKIECSGDHKFLVKGKWMTVYNMLHEDGNTETLNISVADMHGDTDVFRKQIHENLFQFDEESKAA